MTAEVAILNQTAVALAADSAVTIERGQVQFINNRQFAHSRTDFTDAPEPHLKRHMIRLWTREEMLPTPSEFTAPGLWLARIDLPES